MKETGTELMPIEIEYGQDELSDIILSIASGEKKYEDLLEWVSGHSVERFSLFLV